MLARADDRASRALGALRGFIKVHVPMGGDAGSLVIDFDAIPGLADSGDLVATSAACSSRSAKRPEPPVKECC